MTRCFGATVVLIAASLCGCASTPIDPGLLNNARFAIEQAENAGAREYAPLELRQTSDRLRLAQTAIEERDGERAAQMAEQSELLAQLALARTRAAHTRQQLDSARFELQRLEQDLIETYGEGVIPE